MSGALVFPGRMSVTSIETEGHQGTAPHVRCLETGGKAPRSSYVWEEVGGWRGLDGVATTTCAEGFDVLNHSSRSMAFIKI